jgi:hypothetical protein
MPSMMRCLEPDLRLDILAAGLSIVCRGDVAARKCSSIIDHSLQISLKSYLGTRTHTRCMYNHSALCAGLQNLPSYQRYLCCVCSQKFPIAGANAPQPAWHIYLQDVKVFSRICFQNEPEFDVPCLLQVANATT